MPVRQQPPASGQAAGEPLAQQDIDASADELVAYLRLWADVWPRREQREWSAFYLCGQLANLERKTIEPMVLALKGPDLNAMRGLQQFIGQSPWAVRPKRERLQQLVGGWLGDPQAVLIFDGSGFPKQGAHSAGAAPQYCGALGKIANCQQGVFAVYTSAHGYAFVDGRLYMPDRWFGDDYAARRKACGLPADVHYQAETDIALAMLAEILAAGHLPFRWVTADEHFGEIPAFLDAIAAAGKRYQVEVPTDTRVWLRTPAVQPPGAGLMGRPRIHPRVAPSAPRPIEMRVLAQATAGFGLATLDDQGRQPRTAGSRLRFYAGDRRAQPPAWPASVGHLSPQPGRPERNQVLPEQRAGQLPACRTGARGGHALAD